MSGDDYLIGIDVGGTRLRVRAENAASGTRSATVEVPVPLDLLDMIHTITSMCAGLRGDGHIASVAVGLPGHVRGDYCVWIPNLRFLDGQPLAKSLSDALGAPVQLINDAQATLLAEAHEGAARHHPNVVLIAVGTGIGGAIQVNNELVQGANGCAGSFGWLPFPGPPRDEDHGQWERAASGQSLESTAEYFGGTNGLVDAARRGDARAIAIFNEYGALLGQGIAGLASILDPNVVILAGGLVAAYDLFGATLATAVVAHGSPAGRGIPVIPAALGHEAGAVGALRWARHLFEAVG